MLKRSAGLMVVTIIATGFTFSSQPIFADEWEVAKGVQRIVLPAAPSGSAKGLIVVKVRIDSAGGVVWAKTQKGERGLASVVEPALLGWKYISFQYAGEPAEVEAFVYVVFEPSENRYYVQGDHCALYGPPGAQAAIHEIKEDPASPAECGRLPVPPDDDPMWLQKRVDSSDGIVLGKPKHREQPPYPEAARRAGVSGDVSVAVVLNKAGSVVYAAPLKGPALLLPASVAAARKWAFTPATQDSEPVIVRGSVSFHFRI